MDRATGQVIEGIAQLQQSVRDILETPIGTRVMNREYGSRLFDLLDDPTDQRFSVEVFQAVAQAIRRWEPRFALERIVLVEIRDNGPIFDLYGVDLELGRGVILERI